MGFFSGWQIRRQAKQEVKQQVQEMSENALRDEVTLEKGDFTAIVISGLFFFVLPVMATCGGICLIAYLLLMLF